MLAESDFPRSCIIGFGSSPSRCGPEQHALRALPAGRGTSRFPYKKLLHMPGSVTTQALANGAPVRMAFHIRNCVGTQDDRSFAVQWLACALPCRRFAGALAGVCALLGADVDRLLLHRKGLAPSTPCRSSGALRKPSQELPMGID